MTTSTLLLFLGTHIAIAVIARVLQGLSAALVWVSGLAFLTSHVEAKHLGWVMGIISVAQGAGELLGPVVGGVMYEHAGHFAVLGLVCAVLGVDMVLRIILVDKSPDHGADEEASPLLPDRREDPQSIQQSPQQWKEPTGNTAEQSATISLLGYRLSRDFCASCYAVSCSGIILFALEAVSHSVSSWIKDQLMAPDSFQLRIAPLWMDDVRKRRGLVRVCLPHRTLACGCQLHDEVWTSLDKRRGLSRWRRCPHRVRIFDRRSESHPSVLCHHSDSHGHEYGRYIYNIQCCVLGGCKEK